MSNHTPNPKNSKNPTPEEQFHKWTIEYLTKQMEETFAIGKIPTTENPPLVNGVDFKFQNGDLVIPRSFNLNSPGAFRTLQLAQEAYPIFQLIDRIQQLFDRIDDRYISHFSDLGHNKGWMIAAHSVLWDDGVYASQAKNIDTILDAEILGIVVGERTRIYMDLFKRGNGWDTPKVWVNLVKQRNQDIHRKQVAKRGYIYLVKKTDSDQYKIGKTINLEQRTHLFSVKLPFEVAVIHSFIADDYSRAESILHKKYADKRVNGEWFSLTPDDVEHIKSIKSM